VKNNLKKCEFALIDYVNPDCICTSFDYTKKLIKKDSFGFINLVLNTNGKFGEQKIFATVKANTKEKFYGLILKVNVIQK